MALDAVYTRDTSSGRVHIRLREGGRLIPYGGESDNLDDAGAYEVLTEDELSEVDSDALCRRCFPQKQDQQTG